MLKRSRLPLIGPIADNSSFALHVKHIAFIPGVVLTHLGVGNKTCRYIILVISFGPYKAISRHNDFYIGFVTFVHM